MRPLIRNGRYLSVTARVGTKSNYRILLTHHPVTSIVHYSASSPGCVQTVTPTHVQRDFTCLSTEHGINMHVCVDIVELKCGKLEILGSL